jgi:hypothetical protein
MKYAILYLVSGIINPMVIDIIARINKIKNVDNSIFGIPNYIVFWDNQSIIKLEKEKHQKEYNEYNE